MSGSLDDVADGMKEMSIEKKQIETVIRWCRKKFDNDPQSVLMFLAFTKGYAAGSSARCSPMDPRMLALQTLCIDMEMKGYELGMKYGRKAKREDHESA